MADIIRQHTYVKIKLEQLLSERGELKPEEKEFILAAMEYGYTAGMAESFYECHSIGESDTRAQVVKYDFDKIMEKIREK